MNQLQLIGNPTRFSEIWAVDFEFQDPEDGNRVRPVCMVAEDLLSGRQIRLWRDELSSRPPFDIGDDALFVSFSAPAEFACFLQLGWPKPKHILDLYVEFTAHRNGRGGMFNPTLLEVMEFFNLSHISYGEKTDMRKLITERTSWSRDEKRSILEYCYTDVLALRSLLPCMIPHIKRPQQALLRGDYMWAVAVAEHNGIPFNTSLYYELRESWPQLQWRLVERVNRKYGVYVKNADGSYTANMDLLEKYLVANNIGWPVLESGELETTKEVFKERSKIFPQLTELRYLREALGNMRLFDFPVGTDGFCRTWLRPFSSRTGRNQPSSSSYLFGAASWLRVLAQAPPGFALGHLDWSNQEFALAAYLSGDPRMIQAYESGDPYIYFAKFAGAIPQNGVPPGATLADLASVVFQDWEDVRSLYKTTVLSTQFFIGAPSLASRIDRSVWLARSLLRMHRETFRVYWEWLESRITDTFETAVQETVFGWPAHISDFTRNHKRPDASCNYRSVGNFFCQGNGAECLRLSVVRIVAEGIFVCGTSHDAITIMAPTDQIDAKVAQAREIMEWGATQVTAGHKIRVDAHVFRHRRFFYKIKPKARTMWHTVHQTLKALR